MKITITIQNGMTNRNYDIQVDDSQKIKTTLRVLKEYLPEALAGLTEDFEIQSRRSHRMLDQDKSYAEVHLYNCDILLMRNKERENGFI